MPPAHEVDVGEVGLTIAHPGLEGTRWDLPETSFDDIRRRTEMWEPTAIGNRPGDHIVRDVILGPLLRDRRQRLLRTLSRKNRSNHWVGYRVAQLSQTAHRRVAARLVAAHYLHRCGVARRARAASFLPGLDVLGYPQSLRGDSRLATAIKLGACRPNGADYRWSGGDTVQERPDDPGDIYTCKLAWLCPWCRGRAVAALIARLQGGPCRPAAMRNKHIVRAGLRITADQLASIPGFVEFHSRKGTRNLLSDVRAVRDFLLASLGPITREFEGGARSIRVEPITPSIELVLGGGQRPWEPYKPEDVNYGRVARLGFQVDVVGTMADETFERWRTRWGGRIIRTFAGYDPFEDIERRVEAQIHLSAISTRYRAALRLMLAGSAYGYDPTDAGFWWNGVRPEGYHLSDDGDGYSWSGPDDEGRRTFLGPRALVGKRGINGSLSWSVWDLADRVQWWDYAEATAGMRLAETFGSWRSRRRSCKPRVVSDASRATLARINEKKKISVAASLAPAEAAGRHLLDSNPKIGYRGLRAGLQAAGISVSERSAMELLARLKA